MVGKTTYPQIRPLSDFPLSRGEIGFAQKYIEAGLTDGEVKR
jgi:hypothetical protein